jgi:hypothetical protein
MNQQAWFGAPSWGPLVISVAGGRYREGYP